jgi:uncharacterized membrane protein YdbT with pleckstrin-like domain
MFRDAPVAFVIIICLIPVFGFGLALLLVWYIRCLTDRLTIAEGRVVHSHGILSKSVVEVSTSSIRSVHVHQRLLQRIFNSGRVSILTAGDKPEIVVDCLPDPHHVKRLLDPKPRA